MKLPKVQKNLENLKKGLTKLSYWCSTYVLLAQKISWRCFFMTPESINNVVAELDVMKVL